MKEVLAQIEKSQDLLREKLLQIRDNGGLTRERYARFLTMQRHLTNGVQRHFMSIAANPLTANKKSLRKFLIGFAQEEEFHFMIAEADLKEMGLDIAPIPFDTNLWWKYFDSIIDTQPFIRLGATCVLENISAKSGGLLDEMIKSSGYLTPKMLRFLTIHRHGPNLDHGAEIIEALNGANLTANEMSDVMTGAKAATIFYMRFVYWMMTGEELYDATSPARAA